MSLEEEDKLLLRNSLAHINHINRDNYTGMYSPLPFFFCFVFLLSFVSRNDSYIYLTVGMALGSVGVCLCVCVSVGVNVYSIQFFIILVMLHGN